MPAPAPAGEVDACRGSVAGRLRELTFVKPGSVEWREAPDPRLESDREVLVRPLAVATCDLDAAIVRGRTPFVGPFPLGHEFVAEVVEVGEEVDGVEAGQRFAVPFQICCGICANCLAGITDSCLNAPAMAMYGLGPIGGEWGGALSDLVRVPFPDFMLVPVPDGVDPITVAAVGDNIPDAWRTVAPALEARPHQPLRLSAGAGAGRRPGRLRRPRRRAPRARPRSRRQPDRGRRRSPGGALRGALPAPPRPLPDHGRDQLPPRRPGARRALDRRRRHLHRSRDLL
jgi:hypothetical protein